MNGSKSSQLFLVGFLSIISFSFCKITQKKKPIEPPVGFDWQGHRGCRGILPENSLPGFLKAIEFPEVVTLELDLAVSKDKQLIVSHEPWFNPTICLLPNGDSIPKKDAERHLIFEKTAAEIRGFDCGSIGNTRFPEQQKIRAYKPTLRETVSEVLKKRAGKPIFWNIEIKSQAEWDGKKIPPIEEFCDIFMREIADLGIEKHCNVQSFDVRPLQIIRKKKPEIRIALLIENLRGLDWNLKNLGFVPEIYSPYYLMVSKKLVRKCHAKNMKIVPWTVNDVASMRQLIRMGVDGIITDYPNLIPNVSAPGSSKN